MTSTPLTLKWSGTTTIKGDLPDFVRDLKHRPGGEIDIHAGISVARSLLAADLVDELKLVIAPATAFSTDPDTRARFSARRSGKTPF